MTIFIAIISIILLIILHELGHFISAKKFGVQVDEFGIGYPPRIFGKKIGETIYSLNWLPLGGFVKIYGHEERINNPKSFSSKPFYQKAIIILAGVAVFWVVAAVLMTAVFIIGAPTLIEDNETAGFKDPKVQVVGIAFDSPAAEAKLEIGDIIKKINGEEIDKVKQIQEFSNSHKGEEITLTIQRGKSIFDVSLLVRSSFPEDQGPIGIALFRTALKKTVWHKAPIEGIKSTGYLTLAIIKGWLMVFQSLFSGQGLPAGVEIGGVVKMSQLFNGIGSLSVSYFLQLTALIAISLALLNVLPIPALDGGWFLFLLIEKIKGRPLNDKLVQNISAFFFVLLVVLMIWVTIKDIVGLF